jgi:hypothetical protein
VLALAQPLPVAALVLTITPGARTIYLQVGTGTDSAANGTVNEVSVVVPASQVGNGNALAMSSNGSSAASFSGSGITCSMPSQVYIGAWSRKPGNGGAGGLSVQLQVTTPAALASGGDALPFSQIGWTSTGNGLGGADIPAGSFTGGTQVLRAIAANTWVENCLSFSYANTTVPAAGTYTGRAVYTLIDP